MSYTKYSDDYARLQERYDQLEGWHEVLREENSEFERKIEILKKALELACKDKLPPDEDVTIKFCDTGFQTSSYEELIEYYKQQAEKEKSNDKHNN